MLAKRFTNGGPPTVREQPARTYLFPTELAASRVLRELGCQVCPELSIDVEHSELGNIRRVFGVVPNVCTRPTPVRPGLYQKLRSVLRQPRNRRLRKDLENGVYEHTPVNRRVIRWILSEAASHGVHLPWALHPMNFDLGMQMSEVHDKRPWPFKVFYSQNIQIRGTGAKALTYPGPMFSLPAVPAFESTWQELDASFRIDPKVALILEADVALSRVRLSSAA